MNEELKQQFLAGTETEKLAMLLAFAVQLTILARGEYEESKRNLEASNETLHRLTSQALAMHVKSDKGYPDGVFIEMVLAGAAQRGITPILEQAFAQAKGMCQTNG